MPAAGACWPHSRGWSSRPPGSSWSCTTDAESVESGEGDPLSAFAGLVDRFGLAEPAETPVSRLPAVPGRHDRLHRLRPGPAARTAAAPVAARLADARYPHGALRHGGPVDAGTGPGPAPGLGPDRRRATGRRATVPALDKAIDRAASRAPTASAPGRSHRPRSSARSTARPIWQRSRRVLEYIAAGDIFQVNLSQRFTARGPSDPLDLYLRLRDRSPAPFAAFLHWDDLAVVSASPEWFYQTRGDRIVTRPIKGTRPRGRIAEDDARLAAELRGVAQGPRRADHDRRPRTQRPGPGLPVWLGRRRGSARASRSFAQVHHLVATVEGRLRPEVGPVDVVRRHLPRRLDHRRRQDPRHGDHRRAGAEPPQPLHRRHRLPEPRAARAASISRSARCSSKAIAPAIRSAAGSWPTPTPRPSTRRRSPRAAALRGPGGAGGGIEP